MSKKIAVITFVGVVVSVALLVYRVYNKPYLDIKNTEADIIISSQFLVNKFETDEEESNSKYLDQVIQIRGPINKVLSSEGKTVITIGEGDMFGNVKCNMLAEDKINNNTLKKGQIVTIKGICTGYLMNVVLIQAIIIN